MLLVQIVGMAVTIMGVAVVATKGDLHVLSTLALNIGDVWMLIACVFYAGYTLGLRNRPAVSGLVFFTPLAGVAFLTSLPLLAFEIGNRLPAMADAKGWRGARSMWRFFRPCLRRFSSSAASS